MHDVPDILRDESAFLAELDAHGVRVKGKTCTCPWHDDRNASAQWSAGDDGVWRVYCHPCARSGNLFDLLEHRTGKSVADQFRDLRPAPTAAPKVRAKAPTAKNPTADLVTLATKADVASFCQRLGEVAAWYKYGDPAAPALIVARINLFGQAKKSFLQFSPLPGGGYAAKCLIPDGEIPLYGSHDLPPGDVLVVEGEKCADACRAIGVPAVSSAMGAGKAHKSNWATLAGRRVVLWPDNDKTDEKSGKNPGRDHMRQVAEILRGNGCDLYLIDPTEYGLPEKGDVYDLIQAHAKEVDPAATVRGIMEAAESLGASRSLAQRLDDIIAGKFCSLATDWPNIDKLTNWLIPGCITALCADPGAGKSLMLLQLVARLLADGIKPAIYMLEDQESVHLLRALVQASGEPRLFDLQWVKANADQARELLTRHRPAMDRIGAVLNAEGDQEITRADLLTWAEAKAKAGARVVIIDPVTAAKTEREPWAADAIFVIGIKAIARKYQCSVIVALHPRGTNKEPALGGMAGGLAYSRFAHTVLWIQAHQVKRSDTLAGPIDHKRTLQILKSRNGKGSGSFIGGNLDGGSMRLAELGLIIEPPKGENGKPMRGRPAPPDDPLSPQERASRAERIKAVPSTDEDIF